MTVPADAIAHLFGDDIDTDALAPGRYMAAPIEELARHCLETVDAHFAAIVRPGDLVIAGRNFGMGSSREQAAQALKTLGVAAVIATSFGGIFYRNAINLGLPVYRHDGAPDLAANGDRVKMDVDAASFSNLSRGQRVQLARLPDFLLQIIHNGGLVGHLERQFEQRRTKDGAGQ